MHSSTTSVPTMAPAIAASGNVEIALAAAFPIPPIACVTQTSFRLAALILTALSHAATMITTASNIVILCIELFPKLLQQRASLMRSHHHRCMTVSNWMGPLRPTVTPQLYLRRHRLLRPHLCLRESTNAAQCSVRYIASFRLFRKNRCAGSIRRKFCRPFS